MKTRRHNALGAQILATAVVLTGCNSILDNTEGRLSTGGASGGTQTSIGGNASNAGGSFNGSKHHFIGRHFDYWRHHECRWKRSQWRNRDIWRRNRHNGRRELCRRHISYRWRSRHRGNACYWGCGYNWRHFVHG